MTHHAPESTPAARAVPGPRLAGLAGVIAGTIGLGLTPWRLSGGLPMEPIGHTVAVFLCFVPIASGFIVVSRAMKADSRWRDLAGATLAGGIAIVVLFFGFGALAESEGTPLHAVAGLFQRVLVFALVLVTALLGARLLRIARTG